MERQGSELKSSESRGNRGLDDFLSRTLDSLFRTAYLITGDVGESEDLLQETFLRLAARWRRVSKMEHPAAYARRILINLAMDGNVQRNRRGVELRDPNSLYETVDLHSGYAHSGVNDRAEFVWALSKLTPRQRAVLTMRYWGGLSESEIAEILGCPVGTVKSTAARAIAQLRLALAPDRIGTRETTAMESEGRKRC